MSTYTIDRRPERFNGHQADFVQRSDRIVAQTIEGFRASVREGKDLVQVFHAVMEKLGSERNQIAQDHGYTALGSFGISRLSEAGFSSPVGLTVLIDPYSEYGRKMIAAFRGWLETMPHTNREFTMKEKTFREPTCFGRAMTATVNIFSNEDQRKWLALTTPKEVCEACRVCEVPPPNSPEDSQAVVEQLVGNKQAMARLKEREPEVYKRMKLTLAVNLLRTIDPEKRKSDYALVTRRLQIDGKMYALTQYLTWMYRDFREDPVEKMFRSSRVTLIHQDPFLVEATLNDAAKVFKEAIECSRNDLKTLKERMALINYLAAHAMRSSRGESAIIEWLERAIYGYHGFKVEYNQKKMVNLEALTSSLDEFAKNYDSTIKLVEIGLGI